MTGIFLITIPSSNVDAHPSMDSTPVSGDLRDPKYLDKNACARDRKNLLQDGSMGPDNHGTPWGSVSDSWNPFVVNGSPPTFRWVDNESIDPGGAQQIYSTDSFDAGVLQTVYGAQPGSYYWVRWGWSVGAKSGGSYSVDNTSVDSIINKVGADPYGGADAKSPNVVWGPDLLPHKGALNAIEMVLVFPARADHVTIFLRGIAKEGGNGENRVWIDAICMEARPELGNAPAASLPPTATPLPPPTGRPSATRIPPTRAPARSATPLPSATRESVTEVALAPVVPRATATRPPSQSIRARPVVAAPSFFLFDLETDTLVNIGYGSIGGSLFFFLTGLIIARYAFR
jgi:hypothetical protein